MTLYEFDNEMREKYGIICGVDEAGRGPLAGPVVAAAVIFPEGVEIEGVNDSKKLSEKKREKLYDEILEKCWGYGIGCVYEKDIDEINILNATMLAMKNAVEDFVEAKKVDMILIDGDKAPDDIGVPVETVVKGDAKSQSIAAASIIAKVTRDRYMKEQAKLYPEYHFEKHKGYGTKEHREAILEYGLCPIHRRCFIVDNLEKWKRSK